MRETLLKRTKRAGKAAGRFFVRIAQAGRAAKVYDEYTLPLFPFTMIMECEGLLSKDLTARLTVVQRQR